MRSFSTEFIEFALSREVLRFGEFMTKAGRLSPYFFNSGLFNDGESLSKLGEFYAKAVLDSKIDFDMLYGPAYKGIPLVSATAIALADMGCNRPFCFNRKEAKDHGEGGNTVGAPLKGRVLIVDDVISAGTSVRESVEIIKHAGAEPCCVAISLDRMERGLSEKSAVEEVESLHGLPVISIANLDDLLCYLEMKSEMNVYLEKVRDYRNRYGAKSHA